MTESEWVDIVELGPEKVSEVIDNCNHAFFDPCRDDMAEFKCGSANVMKVLSRAINDIKMRAMRGCIWRRSCSDICCTTSNSTPDSRYSSSILRWRSRSTDRPGMTESIRVLCGVEGLAPGRTPLAAAAAVGIPELAGLVNTAVRVGLAVVGTVCGVSIKNM
ncbi:hypothetical protein HK100_005066 [Physocladia obscura]|uniref:Uncharacterized protein n=1 Tax=Physocladia obscura TaxID=109957 RepID=A0AAD5XC59_9FUNG|nr:hypothetical protein HK100_005066 [Physocladia obscura]